MKQCSPYCACYLSDEYVNEKKELCEALMRLKEEHIPLNRMKNQMHDLTLKFSTNTSPEHYTQSLLILRKEVQSFSDALKLHCEKEEHILFPMMQKYIGKETGPLVVMEYEHNDAKTNIESFLHQTSRLSKEISEEQFTHLLHYIMKTDVILTTHFMKEEMVLFPMAEDYLSNAEKEELLQRI